MKLETIIEYDYSFHAAGSIWVVPSIRLACLPNGNLGYQKSEIDRVHRAIANQICGRAARLVGRELQFLSSIKQTKQNK